MQYKILTKNYDIKCTEMRFLIKSLYLYFILILHKKLKTYNYTPSLSFYRIVSNVIFLSLLLFKLIFHQF